MFWIGATIVLVWMVQQSLGRRLRANAPTSANTLFLGGLTAVVLVNSLGLATYSREIRFETLLFICISIFAFGLGAILAGWGKAIDFAKVQRPSNYDRVVLRICYLLLLGYCAFIVPEIPTLISSTLQELRSEHWKEAGEETGLVGLLKAAARFGPTVLMICLPQLRGGARAAGVLSMLLIALETASVGGRFMLAAFLVAMLINYLALRGKGFHFNPVLIVVMGAIAYFGLVIFPLMRNPYLASNPMPFFRFVDDIVPSAAIIGMDAGWIRDHLIGLAKSSVYLSSAPYKLQFFVQVSEVQNWHSLGAYNVRYLQVLHDLFGSDAPNFAEARDRIEQHSRMAGYSGNPWSMGFRDLLIDFGWVGSVVATAVIGFLLTRWSAAVLESRVIVTRTLGALSSISGLVFVFHSPFILGMFLNAMILLLALDLVRRVLERQLE